MTGIIGDLTIGGELIGCFKDIEETGEVTECVDCIEKCESYYKYKKKKISIVNEK